MPAQDVFSGDCQKIFHRIPAEMGVILTV